MTDTPWAFVHYDMDNLPGEPPVRTVLTGHPPIPSDALPALRRHLGPEERSARWWRENLLPWFAVLDLHRQGDNDTATALATLLAWAERPGVLPTLTAILAIEEAS